MTDIFGDIFSTDDLGDDPPALDAFVGGAATGGSWTAAPSAVSKHANHPLLKRSRLYYKKRVDQALVGLDNHCYLNSLLQSLYLTPEFRALLFSLSDVELGLAAYHAHELAEAQAKAALEAMTDAQRAAHKAAVALQSVEVNEESLAELTAMGVDPINARRALRKFPKPSQKEQAMEYVFSHDFASDPPEPAEPASSKPKKREYKRIPIEFRRFFAQLQLGTQTVIGTEGITKSFGWDSKEGQASVQHDIQELYIRLMEALSGSLAGSSAEARMQSLYRGTMVTRTTCSECGNVSERREHCYNFHAHVKGMKNLRESMAAAATPEKLEGANAYFCHNAACKRKVTAWRQDSIATLPPLLSIALNRHEYNKKNWQRVKINDRLPFPLVMDMAPYHEANAAKSREQLEAEDAKAKAVANSRSAPASSSSAAAAPAQPPQTDLDIAIANSLKEASAPADEAQKGASNAEGSSEKKEAESSQSPQQSSDQGSNKGGQNQSSNGTSNVSTRKGLKDAPCSDPCDETGLEPSVFDPSSAHLYDLFSIVVHSGGAHGGHYFAYVLDVIGQEKYWMEHPEAREQYASFCRDPAGASSATAAKAGGYSIDQSKSRHPSFWWELNDTSVSNIGFDKIASQYGGRKTCAYILMYRHRSLQSSEIVQGAGPIVPEALQERMARFNSQLDEERQIYDTISNEIEIELHSEEEFCVHAGQLYPAGYDPTKPEREDEAANGVGKGGPAVEEKSKHIAPPAGDAAASSSVSPVASAAVAPAASMEAINAPPRRFAVDQRITVPELHARVSAYLEAEAAAAAKAGSPAPCLIPEKLALNQLSIRLRPPHQVEGCLNLDDPSEASATTTASGGGGHKAKKKPNPKTLEQLGFSAVQPLLVWNGTTINSAPFNPGTKQEQLINLHAVLFGAEVIEKVQARAALAAAKAVAEGVAAPEPLVATASTGGDRLEFYLAVSAATNVSVLSSLLLSRLGLDGEHDDYADRLYLVSMHPSSKSTKVLPVRGTEDEQNKPIKIMGVVNHSWMGVEFRAAQGQGQGQGQQAGKSLDSSSSSSAPKKEDDDPVAARIFFGELAQCVRLVVVNDLPAALGVSPGDKPPAAALLPKFELEATKSSTVGALKATIFERLRAAGHPELKPSQFRLRKMIGMHKAGVLLQSETATLSQADLAQDDLRVRAEEGGLPDPATQLDMLVTLLANVSVGTAAGSSMSTTAGSLGSETAPPKQALAKLVDRAPFLAERSWTIKQTKAAMLARFGLGHRHESAFCLHRGHATYDEHAKAFTSEFMTLAAMQIGQSEWMWLEEGEVPTSGMVRIEVVMCMPQTGGAASSSAAASDDPTLSLRDWRAMQQPLAPYTPAAPVADNLMDPALTYVFVTPAPSYLMSNLFTLKFSFHDSLLELKQVLHSYPNSPLGSAPSPSHLRVRQATRADGFGKWLNVDERSLKKQGVSSDKRLIVQMLPADRPETGLSAGALLLRLCTAVPARDSGVVVGGAALQEFVFDDGEHPQLSALQSALSAFTGIPDAESIAVLKWVGVRLANKEALEKDAGADKEKEAAKGKTDETAATMPAAGASASAVPKGWVVLFPNGPDPSDPVAVAASANKPPSDGKKGGSQQQQQQSSNGGGKQQGQGQQQQGGGQGQAQAKKGQQQQQNQSGDGKGKGGKGGQNQAGGGKGKGGGNAGESAPAKPPVPAWSLKSGLHALHEDDVLCCVRFGDFGLANGDLSGLSSLVRAWDLGVAPPGYLLVEKARAEEMERSMHRGRGLNISSKHKEIELRIEY